MDARRSEVSEFLKNFKGRMTTDELILVPRKANLDAIARLGFTVYDVEATILNLTEGDYAKGPEADEDMSAGEVWVFGATVGGYGLYIKLKLDSVAAKCLSFHEAQFRLRLPYR